MGEEIVRKNIYLIGPMGAGKTSIGRQLARELGYAFYDSDHVIEERTGADVPWIYDLEGEEGFRRREVDVIQELTQLQGIVLSTGGSTVIAPENRVALSSQGVIIYLKTSLDDQMERTSRSHRRPIAHEKSARRRALIDLREQCEPLYESLADLSYDTDRRPSSSLIKAIVQDLKREHHL